LEFLKINWNFFIFFEFSLIFFNVRSNVSYLFFFFFFNFSTNLHTLPGVLRLVELEKVAAAVPRVLGLFS
jgi:hypothetical protein